MKNCGGRPLVGRTSNDPSDGTGYTYLHSARGRCDVGAQLSVQSDVTGDRPVTDRSFLTVARQSGTPHVCPYCIECGRGQWRLGEGLGAKRCEGPRGMTWHPEASWLLLRFAGCGGRAKL
uniref:DUF1263 domain-containing protein n=1 Tax=Oryza sativa subsp. japonica TaxID=39947 RepID=Q6ET60_ORYSJ|nr:hypothetical protein [Oryza sativa Japonica Group]